MTNAQLKRCIAQIGARQAAIAKERDKLVELISEWDSLKDDCQEAWDSLEQARDALSRLV